jgi:hypothetical protein
MKPNISSFWAHMRFQEKELTDRSKFVLFTVDFDRLARGSHNIYGHPQVSELVNVQNVKGEVKPYQAKQFLRLVERNNIKMEPEQ